MIIAEYYVCSERDAFVPLSTVRRANQIHGYASRRLNGKKTKREYMRFLNPISEGQDLSDVRSGAMGASIKCQEPVLVAEPKGFSPKGDFLLFAGSQSGLALRRVLPQANRRPTGIIAWISTV